MYMSEIQNDRKVSKLKSFEGWVLLIFGLKEHLGLLCSLSSETFCRFLMTLTRSNLEKLFNFKFVPKVH